MYFADYFLVLRFFLFGKLSLSSRVEVPFQHVTRRLVTDYTFLGVALELLVQGYTLAWLLAVSRYPRQCQVFVSNRTVEDSYVLLGH